MAACEVDTHDLVHTDFSGAVHLTPFLNHSHGPNGEIVMEDESVVTEEPCPRSFEYPGDSMISGADPVCETMEEAKPMPSLDEVIGAEPIAETMDENPSTPIGSHPENDAHPGLEETPPPLLTTLQKEHAWRQAFYDAPLLGLDLCLSLTRDLTASRLRSYLALIGMLMAGQWVGLDYQTHIWAMEWIVPTFVWFLFFSGPLQEDSMASSPYLRELGFLLVSVLVGPRYGILLTHLVLVWVFASRSRNEEVVSSKVALFFITLGAWFFGVDLRWTIWTGLLYQILTAIEPVTTLAPKSLRVFAQWVFSSLILGVPVLTGLGAAVSLVFGSTSWLSVPIWILSHGVWANRFEKWKGLRDQASAQSDRVVRIYRSAFGDTSLVDLLGRGQLTRIIEVFVK